jgi:hypothetical protein
MAEVKREIQTGGGVLLSNDIRRGRVDPSQINRIKNDGNTQLRTAAQKNHQASLGDRMNALLRKAAPEHEQRVQSGIWGSEIEREVPPELHTEDERRMLDTADDGTTIKETAFVGTAPYDIRDLGDGRIVVRITKPDTSVMVGVGKTLDEAVGDLERQVKS